MADQPAQPRKLTPLFRRAVEGDIPRVMEIFKRSFKGHAPDLEIDLYKIIFEETISDLRYHFTVAVQNGKVEGFAFINSVDTPRNAANLDVIGVAPAAQGTGIGKGLMREAEKATARFRRSRLQLQVREDNASAIGFYKKLGYSEVGFIPFYYVWDGTHALVMEKQVPAIAQDNVPKPLKSPRPFPKPMK